MKTTIDWLDAAKAKHGLSDYALAPRLGVSKSQMSKYRQGKDALGDDAALRVAHLLDVDPRLVIAAVHAERAKTPEAREFWQRWAAAAVAAAAFIGGPGGPPPAVAASGDPAVIVMSNGTRRRRRSPIQAITDVLARTADSLLGPLAPLRLA